MKYLSTQNIILFILFVACYFSIFLHLGTPPIQIWDEGTYAVNAYEMYQRGDYLVKYFDGGPDMWATNPPLVCYLQTLCFKLIGPGEVAVRLPSALAAIGVVLLIMRFSVREKLGLDFTTYAVLSLITARGYIYFHVTRTGDLDSVLIFFITGSIMYFYKFIEYPERKVKYLIIFSIFLLLGYFTKGIACFLILPGLFIYAVLKNKILYVLKTKELYFSIIFLLSFIFLYYYLREQRTPGYIDFMLKSEVGRWYTVGKEHAHPFSFFIESMYERDFKHFIMFIPAFLLMFLFLPKENIYKQKGLIWIISAICFLFIISYSKTKLEWYEAPTYPMLCIYFALGLKAAINFKSYGLISNYVVKSAFILALFSLPYITIVKTNLTKEPGWHDIKFGKALKAYNKIKDVPKEMEMLVTGYNGHAVFYKMLYNDKYKYKITIRDVAGNIKMVPGKVYLFTHPAIFDYLRSTFDYEVFMDIDGMFVVKTLNFKTINPAK